MKSGPFRRFSVCAVALTLVFAVANAAGSATNRPAADSTNGTLLASIKWHAHRAMLAIGITPYLDDIDASFVSHLIAYVEAATRPAPDHDTRLRQIAEQIADGQAKEIESMKKVSVPPCKAAKGPVR